MPWSIGLLAVLAGVSAFNAVTPARTGDIYCLLRPALSIDVCPVRLSCRPSRQTGSPPGASRAGQLGEGAVCRGPVGLGQQCEWQAEREGHVDAGISHARLT